MADSSACWKDSVPVQETNATLINTYLDKAGVSASIQKGGVRWFAGECMKRWRVVDCHKDGSACSGAVNVDLGALQGAQLGTTALGAGIGIAGAAGAFSSGGALAGIGLTSAVAGIATAGIGLLAIPFALIAKHAANVALEDKTLCEISQTFNAYEEQIEQALRSGRITVGQAQLYMSQVESQMISALQPHVKSYNGYYYFTMATKATSLFLREQVYSKLAPSQVASTVGAVLQGAGVPQTVAGFNTSTVALLAGGLLLFKKFF